MDKRTQISIEQDANQLPKPETPFDKEEVYEVDVVGESFNNDDGSSRQDIIKSYISKKSIIDLEFYLYEGEPACRVMIAGKQIGHLPKTEAKKLFEHIKRGGDAQAKVSHFGKSKESGLYGVTLKIDKYIPEKIKKTLDLLPCQTCSAQVSKKAEVCPNCGEVLREKDTSKKKEIFVQTNQKSRLTSFILTLLFGPLGLLYSSVVGGIIMIVVAITTAPTGIGPVVAWVISIIWGDSATYNYNKKIEKQAELIG